MYRYSPCLDIFFKDLPFSARIQKAAALGFQAFEFWSWWDKDLGEIEAALRSSPIQVAGFCTRMVSLVDPAKRAEYLAGLEDTLAVAKRLKPSVIISQVGNERPGVAREEQARSLVEGLKAAAALLERTGDTLVIEPLNVRVDHKGYFLSRSDEAAEILAQVGSPRVKMLFDVYHQQITEGDLLRRIRQHLPLIGHFHIADNPGRHEIGGGEIHYPNVLAAIKEAGYGGCVGLEFFPSGPDHGAALKQSALAV